MRKIVEIFKSEISLILVLIYSLGYSYLFVYYKLLGIPIEYYVNITDILFKAIEILLQIVLLYLLQAMLLSSVAMFVLRIYYSRILNFRLWKRKIKKEVYKRYSNTILERSKENNIELVVFFLYVLLGAFLFYIPDDFRSFDIVYILFLIVRMYFLTHKIEVKEPNKFRELLVGGFVVFLLLSFIVSAQFRSVAVKNGNISKIIEFKDNGKLISTSNSNINYIGESSTYIFLYDKTTRESLIFSKQKVEELKYGDSFVKEKAIIKNIINQVSKIIH